jgi:hypothetical protein
MSKAKSLNPNAPEFPDPEKPTENAGKNEEAKTDEVRADACVTKDLEIESAIDFPEKSQIDEEKVPSKISEAIEFLLSDAARNESRPKKYKFVLPPCSRELQPGDCQCVQLAFNSSAPVGWHYYENSWYPPDTPCKYMQQRAKENSELDAEETFQQLRQLLGNKERKETFNYLKELMEWRSGHFQPNEPQMFLLKYRWQKLVNSGLFSNTAACDSAISVVVQQVANNRASVLES